MVKKITTPLTESQIEDLRSGDQVLISGTIFTGRDAAHKRMIELIDKGEELPLDVAGQIIYYVGPTPPKPGKPIGSAGPTTSGRMDAYSPKMMAKGLKGMIGKGYLSGAVKEAIRKHKCIYFGAIGGAGAYLARQIKSAEIVAYEDLGPEAIRKLEVQDFPAVVIHDAFGGDLYAEGQKKFAVAP